MLKVVQFGEDFHQLLRHLVPLGLEGVEQPKGGVSGARDRVTWPCFPAGYGPAPGTKRPAESLLRQLQLCAKKPHLLTPQPSRRADDRARDHVMETTGIMNGHGFAVLRFT
jgi:hypothetical protein